MEKFSKRGQKTPEQKPKGKILNVWFSKGNDVLTSWGTGFWKTAIKWLLFQPVGSKRPGLRSLRPDLAFSNQVSARRGSKRHQLFFPQRPGFWGLPFLCPQIKDLAFFLIWRGLPFYCYFNVIWTIIIYITCARCLGDEIMVPKSLTSLGFWFLGHFFVWGSS